MKNTTSFLLGVAVVAVIWCFVLFEKLQCESTRGRYVREVFSGYQCEQGRP